MISVRDIDLEQARQLLARYGLQLESVAEGQAIPGSYWGDAEAGLIGIRVYARADTPVHSMLHEACHLIVLPDDEARAAVHTNATDSVEEENAVCVLQILLAEQLDGVTRDAALTDMDAWGYTFRLGSAKAYFESDADDSWQWLQDRGLVSRDRSLILPN